jgi:ubiquinone/menaquinone biosynthesis C-methylase UbiE
MGDVEQRVTAQNTGNCAEDSLAAGEVALHLGSGRHVWTGWCNIDGFNAAADVQADLRKLPFPDSHADRAVAVHVFEHFYQWEVADLLLEWKRVLRPGGRLVLELPCMDKVFGYIVHRLNKGAAPSPMMSWLPLWGDPKYKDPAMSHKWGYFNEDMRRLLTAAGFEQLSNPEARYHFPIRDMRWEAVKPKGDANGSQ